MAMRPFLTVLFLVSVSSSHDEVSFADSVMSADEDLDPATQAAAEHLHDHTITHLAGANDPLGRFDTDDKSRLTATREKDWQGDVIGAGEAMMDTGFDDSSGSKDRIGGESQDVRGGQQAIGEGSQDTESQVNDVIAVTLQIDSPTQDVASVKEVKWPSAATLAFEFLPLSTSVEFSGDCENRTCVIVNGRSYPLAPFVSVSRPEIVPTFERNGNIFPARYYAYAKFGKDKNGEQTNLTVGGFIYLDDMEKPIQEIRKLNHHNFGAMRFDEPVEVVGWESQANRLQSSTELTLTPSNEPYWFPITVGALADAGIGYYTWVVIGEHIHTVCAQETDVEAVEASGCVKPHTGGFMYAAQKPGTGDTAIRPRFFPMKSSNADCAEGNVVGGRFNGFMAEAKDTESNYATRYDYWLDTRVKSTQPKYPAAKDWSMDKDTVLFVIDMQNDFIWGTFKQDCVAKRNNLMNGVVQMIEMAAKVKATIIASVDYHSVDHCSFMAVHGFQEDLACKNTENLEENFQNSSGGAGRYKNNAFPAHTWWNTGSESNADHSVPSHGALLVAPVRAALAQAKKDGAAVHTVFKGFQKDKDSFSAVPHFKADSPVPESGTGGYALPTESEVDSEGLDKCYTFTQITEEVLDQCFPKVSQMENADSQMTRVDHLLANINGNSQIIVTGLVHDFCVKETAIYVKRFADEKTKCSQAPPPQTFGQRVRHQFSRLTAALSPSSACQKVPVVVHVDYSRPALEGLGLGAPLTLPDGTVMPDDILGTAKHMDNTAEHFKQYNVGYIMGKGVQPMSA